MIQSTVGIQGTAYFQNPIHIGWVVGGKNYLEATIFPIDDPTWFRGMIQSTTEPIGQPLVMGSGAMLVIYICYIYMLCYVYIYIFWLVVWNVIFFPFTWECHHPNWLIFFRGVGIPPTRYMYIYIHHYKLYIHHYNPYLNHIYILTIIDCYLSGNDENRLRTGRKFDTSLIDRSQRWWFSTQTVSLPEGNPHVIPIMVKSIHLW